jgi:hypothetical protein
MMPGLGNYLSMTGLLNPNMQGGYNINTRSPVFDPNRPPAYGQQANTLQNYSDRVSFGGAADNPYFMSQRINQFANPSARPYLPAYMPPQMFGMQSPFQMGGLQGTQNPFWR